MTSEKLRDSIDHARSVDSAQVSWFVFKYVYLNTRLEDEDSRLALEVFHDIEEAVIYIGLVGKLDFDLIKVA